MQPFPAGNGGEGEHPTDVRLGSWGAEQPLGLGVCPKSGWTLGILGQALGSASLGVPGSGRGGCGSAGRGEALVSGQPTAARDSSCRGCWQEQSGFRLCVLPCAMCTLVCAIPRACNSLCDTHVVVHRPCTAAFCHVQCHGQACPMPRGVCTCVQSHRPCVCWCRSCNSLCTRRAGVCNPVQCVCVGLGFQVCWDHPGVPVCSLHPWGVCVCGHT